jgi:hypothetical protein
MFLKSGLLVGLHMSTLWPNWSGRMMRHPDHDMANLHGHQLGHCGRRTVDRSLVRCLFHHRSHHLSRYHSHQGPKRARMKCHHPEMVDGYHGFVENPSPLFKGPRRGVNERVLED